MFAKGVLTKHIREMVMCFGTNLKNSDDFPQTNFLVFALAYKKHRNRPLFATTASRRILLVRLVVLDVTAPYAASAFGTVRP